MTEQVTNAWEYGWPVGILVLVLVAIGTGVSWFLKAYLTQQKEEFRAKTEEDRRKNELLEEQQNFIRALANNALQQYKDVVYNLSQTAKALEEITATLVHLNESYSRHVIKSDQKLDCLVRGQDSISERLNALEDIVKELERIN